MQGLTHGGGPGIADMTVTRGCTDDCQTSKRNRQIHVLANNGGTDSSREVEIQRHYYCYTYAIFISSRPPSLMYWPLGVTNEDGGQWNLHTDIPSVQAYCSWAVSV